MQLALVELVGLYLSLGGEVRKQKGGEEGRGGRGAVGKKGKRRRKRTLDLKDRMERETE